MQAFNRTGEKAARQEGAFFLDAASKVPKDLDNFFDDCHYKAGAAGVIAAEVAGYIIRNKIIEERPKGNFKKEQ
jgi:hypothetical protein